MNVERKITASRVDGKLTFSELIEFARWCEEQGVDPGSLIKTRNTLRGHVRSLEVVPDPTREEADHER